MKHLSDGGNAERSLAQGVAEYLRSRLQLLAIESQEAKDHLQGKLVPLLVILVSGVSAYTLIMVALVGLLARALRAIPGFPWLDWEVAALLIALLHVTLLLGMKKALTRPLNRPLFEYSRAELERDRTWLHDNNPAKKS
jgi:uncharacterized membrane protein YqjE